MRAIEAKTFSGYGGLRQIELPKPQPAKDRVLPIAAFAQRGHAAPMMTTIMVVMPGIEKG
jgi:hypothetical protein